MASFVIEGGHRLSGEIHPQGAKNEVLQIICATLLTAEEVTVNNIPDILDVNNLIQLLREMGVTVAKKGIDSYSFKAENVDLAYLESDEFLKKCSSLRGSVMLIGPMVARFGKALISKPGGDKIGRRRLDTHFVGIQNLGADFRYDEERGIYEITADRLQGSYMLLDEASVPEQPTSSWQPYLPKVRPPFTMPPANPTCNNSAGYSTGWEPKSAVSHPTCSPSKAWKNCTARNTPYCPT